MIQRRPIAIRKDYDPFLLETYVSPGAPCFRKFLSPLGFIRWTTFSCPHCLQVFRRDYLPHNVRLGDGERICSKCGKFFDDGSREWPELGASQKLRFLCPTPLIGILAGLLICCVITLAIVPREQLKPVAIVLIIAVGLVPLIPWCLLRMPRIYNSIHRYETELGTTRRILGSRGIE
jgi:hypothetical protein